MARARAGFLEAEILDHREPADCRRTGPLSGGSFAGDKTTGFASVFSSPYRASRARNKRHPCDVGIGRHGRLRRLPNARPPESYPRDSGEEAAFADTYKSVRNAIPRHPFTVLLRVMLLIRQLSYT